MAWKGYGSLAISCDRSFVQSYLTATVVNFSARIPILRKGPVQNDAKAVMKLWEDLGDLHETGNWCGKTGDL